MCRSAPPPPTRLHSTIFKYFFVTVFLLLQCISNGAAIKCFVCDSTDNPSCADLKSNSTIVAEECTLDKMRSINTWLFEMNRFSYFETDRVPQMTCQKVVTRDLNSRKWITARFCQLDTADSDACTIFESKLNKRTDDSVNYMNNNNNNGKRNGRDDAKEENKYHCSTCKEDSCNGSQSLRNNNNNYYSNILLLSASIVALRLVLANNNLSVW